MTALLRYFRTVLPFACAICTAIGGFVTLRQQTIVMSNVQLSPKPLVREAKTP